MHYDVDVLAVALIPHQVEVLQTPWWELQVTKLQGAMEVRSSAPLGMHLLAHQHAHVLDDGLSELAHNL